MPMTLDDIRSQFQDKDSQLLDIVIEAAKWIAPFGFVPTSTPKKDGSPGDTVKFVPQEGSPMLFSLQFHTTGEPFLYFKWTKKTMKRLGIAGDLHTCLFEKIKPLISTKKEKDAKEDVPTEWRLILYPCHKGKFQTIKDILTPLVKRAAEAFAKG